MIKQTFGISKVPFLQSEHSLLAHQQEVVDIVNIHTQHGGLCVVTGDPGTGKSVIRSSLENKGKRKQNLIASFSRTMDTYSGILRQLTDALELEPSHRKIERDIIAFVHEQARSNLSLLTIIDEAHLLDLEALRKLRLFFDRFPKRHCLLLLGQKDLMVRLSLWNNEDIRSRITYSKELKPLSDGDLMSFIQRECDAVKLPSSTFEDGALELILRSVRGNLRLCSNLCYGSILEACRDGDRVVDHTHVNAMLVQPHWRKHEELITGEVPA